MYSVRCGLVQRRELYVMHPMLGWYEMPADGVLPLPHARNQTAADKMIIGRILHGRRGKPQLRNLPRWCDSRAFMLLLTWLPSHVLLFTSMANSAEVSLARQAIMRRQAQAAWDQQRVCRAMLAQPPPEMLRHATAAQQVSTKTGAAEPSGG